MKVDLMILVALALLHTKKHILALAWVAAGSLALLGAKGGLYTLSTGGGGRVWGPPGSFIEDNNEFAPIFRWCAARVAPQPSSTTA